MEEDVRAVLDRRLDPAATAPILVALSGGGDSIALLRLTANWARARGRPILAVTVDHRLHPDSAAWSAFAGEQARALGCVWRALAWTGPKPATGLPAAARAARHVLLGDAAREAGASVVLTGHTADDVLEGEIMRAHDVPTLGRLREWSPSPAWPEGRGVFLLRPLLNVRREALRVWLREQGADWLEDPANNDARFARARARKTLIEAATSSGYPAPPFTGELSPAQRVSEGARRRRGRRESAPSVTALARRATSPASRRAMGAGEEKGVLMLNRREITLPVLSAVLLCAAGTGRPPRSAALVPALTRIHSGEAFTTTLAGARLDARGEAVSITREPGERARGGLAPLPLPLHVPTVWDGRFEITAAAPDLTVAALHGHAAGLSSAERRGLSALPPAARAALPALIDPGGAVSLPAPFGSGPAVARCLVHHRFAAALGAIPDERTLNARASPSHGAARTLTLS